MIIYRFSGFLSAFLLLLTVSASGQNNDAALWLSVNVEKLLTSKTSVTFTEECRLNENISRAGTVFTDLGISHKLNKTFTVSLNYRFIQRRNLDASYSTRHRFYVDVSGRRKAGKFSFTLRERVQFQIRDYNSSETGRIPEWYLRSKLSVKYSLGRKITPMVSAEVYFQLSNPGNNEIDNLRLAAGFEYEINKRHSIEPYYLIQRELNVNDPVTDYIIGLGYNLKLWPKSGAGLKVGNAAP